MARSMVRIGLSLVFTALFVLQGDASQYVSGTSFGHCAFSQQEVLTAFDDLVRWVTEGQRPAGGDATIR